MIMIPPKNITGNSRLKIKSGQFYRADRTAQTVGRVISRSHVVSSTFRQLREIYIGCARRMDVSFEYNLSVVTRRPLITNQRAQHKFTRTYNMYYTIIAVKSQGSKEKFADLTCGGNRNQSNS